MHTCPSLYSPSIVTANCVLGKHHIAHFSFTQRAGFSTLLFQRARPSLPPTQPLQIFCHSVGCNIFYLRIREDHLHAVRGELSNLRKHISALSSKERDVLEASMKTVSEENQAFMKKHLRDETKSLKEDVQKISRENQALKTQLEEVLHILRSQTPQGMVL
jgi:hypothetical protein